MEEQKKSKKKGGLRTMPFIFANEVAEKLAVVGFSTNMLTYLTQQLHMPLVKVATTLTNFGGTSAMTPLVGAYLADAVVGRFWTIAAASVVYQVGMVLLTVSAALQQFRPPPCKAAGAGSGGACEEAAPWQLAVLYVSLFLNAVGAGGYRPCIVAFGADQFDESAAAERARTWGFFNWYYFCNGASMLVAVTAVVYVQDNVGWGWGLGVPAFCMAISVAAFFGGYPMYRRLDPAGSPFTRLAQVVVAAVRKRRVPNVDDPARLYENDDMDAPMSMYGKLVHTEQLSFFDRAAIVTDGDLLTADASTSGKSPPSPAPNPWRLSTVHRVEELKSVLRMGPIWAAGILVITASSQQHTFSLQQASTMDRRLAPRLSPSSFQIPAGSMTVFTLLAMLATLFAYDRALVPLARRATGLDRGISYLHRMGVGFAVSVAATLVAGIVERHRREVAAAAGTTDAGTAPLSAYWLVPQYGGAPGVHVRPGAGEHAQHGDGALLAVHLARELHELAAHRRRAPVERRPRRVQLAAGQHQPRQARLLLLGRDAAADHEPGVLRDLCQVLHVQARAAAPQDGGGEGRQVRGGAAREIVSERVQV